MECTSTDVNYREMASGGYNNKQILVNNNHVKLELVLIFASIKWRRQWMSVSTFNKILLILLKSKYLKEFECYTTFQINLVW